jgi:hypothetical protein
MDLASMSADHLCPEGSEERASGASDADDKKDEGQNRSWRAHPQAAAEPTRHQGIGMPKPRDPGLRAVEADAEA